MTAIRKLADQKVLGQIKLAIGQNKGNEMRARFESYDDAKKVFDAASVFASPHISCISAAPDKFDDSTDAIVALVGMRNLKDSDGKVVNGAVGLVLIPTPSIVAINENEAGADWLVKIVEKEAAHVAFRKLRELTTEEELAAGVESVPTTVTELVTYSSSAVDTSAFDAIYSATREALKANLPSAAFDWYPSKALVLKALRSKAFATEEYERAESAGLFAIWMDVARALAPNAKDKDGKPAPVDLSTLEEMWEGRESFKFQTREAAELDETALVGLDAASLLAKMGQASA